MMTVEQALLIVWDVADQNKSKKAGTDKTKNEQEALDVMHDFIINVIIEDRL